MTTTFLYLNRRPGNIGIPLNGPKDQCSSVASFVKQIGDSIALESAIPGHKAVVSPPKRSQTSEPRQSGAELWVLPPRRAADEMLQCYWNEGHAMYPFIHRPRFQSTYRNLWTGEGEIGAERHTYCLLNAIFALACQITKRFCPSEKEHDAEVYFRRAKQLLEISVLYGGSLEAVQALLLMVQYLQSTNSAADSCRMVLEMAVQIARRLGFHLPATSAGEETQADCELIRRLWYGCIFMDR